MTIQAGQFDDADFSSASEAELFDALVEATNRAPNGMLVLDYKPSQKEKVRLAANLEPEGRSIQDLVAYDRLGSALGEDQAAGAHSAVHGAWSTAARNPYMTHDQR